MLDGAAGRADRCRPAGAQATDGDAPAGGATARAADLASASGAAIREGLSRGDHLLNLQAGAGLPAGHSELASCASRQPGPAPRPPRGAGGAQNLQGLAGRAILRAQPTKPQSQRRGIDQPTAWHPGRHGGGARSAACGACRAGGGAPGGTGGGRHYAMAPLNLQGKALLGPTTTPPSGGQGGESNLEVVATQARTARGSSHDGGIWGREALARALPGRPWPNLRGDGLAVSRARDRAEHRSFKGAGKGHGAPCWSVSPVGEMAGSRYRRCRRAGIPSGRTGPRASGGAGHPGARRRCST